MKKLRLRWGLKNNFDVLIVLLVFCITGYSSLLIAKPILSLVGIEQETTNPWIYRPVRLLLIFPFYQLLILFYGWIFGKFQFFWNLEKKILRSIGLKKFINETPQ